jgi:hypothetical protein
VLLPQFFSVRRVDVFLLFHFLCIYQPRCEVDLKITCHERDITVLWKPYSYRTASKDRTQWNQIRVTKSRMLGAHTWLMNNVKFAIFLYLSRSTYQTLLFDWVAFCVLHCALDELLRVASCWPYLYDWRMFTSYYSSTHQPNSINDTLMNVMIRPEKRMLDPL